MNKVLLILSLMFLVSCSSVHKFGTERYFSVKKYTLRSDQVQANIMYFSTTENDQHCFKDNPKNKEIITVLSRQLAFAMDHFYKRTSKVNIKHEQARKYIHTTITATEEVDFELEMASCIVEHRGSLFSTDDTSYTSFRLKD